MALVPAGLLEVINGPLPRRRPFDLLHYAYDVTPEGTHWEAGADVYPYPGGLPDTHNPCSGGSYGTKDEGEPTSAVQFGGFTAYLPITCTTRGMGSWEEFKSRAEAVLVAKQSYAVELELAYDDAGIGNPHLTEGGITPLGGGTAKKPVEGLALLEDSIAAETAASGVIHAAPSLVAAWSREFLVFHEGNHLVTANGTWVVAGAAYASARFHPSDKSAAGATQNWAFATGDVQYMQSEMLPLPETVKEAVDREQNVVTFRAERSFVVDWDHTFLAEVLIDRSL